jgi:integrase
VINDRAGIQSPRPPAPTLREFRQTFFDWVTGKSKSDYYLTNFNKLLLFEKLADAPLDRIDESLIEAFKMWAVKNVETVDRKPVAKDTINRYVGALRKALRYAHFKLKLIDKLPVFDMYQWAEPRDYVFSQEEYEHWLNSSPEPLKSAPILARNCGICRGEMIALQKDSVVLLESHDSDGFFGEIEIRRGLKRTCRRRTLKINRQMRDALQALIAKSICAHMFTTPDSAERQLSRNTLSQQACRMKAKGSVHKDSGLHTLRHTFLTEMGELTDPFTLQRIAGHNDIKTTMRYVHPQKRAIESAFKKLFGNGQAATVINEVALSSTQVASLLAGEIVLLAVPAGTTELRLKSTQEPTCLQISPTENLASV